MNKTKIAELNKQLTDLQNEYRTVAIDYLKIKDKFIGKLEGLGDEIRLVKGEILREKMPREE